MKHILYLLIFFIATQAAAQTTGGTITPTTKFQQYNKSLLSTGQRSLDGKYKYTDTAHFIERSFRTPAEANLYIPTNQRTVGLTVHINKNGVQNPSSGVITGGLNEDYQYKNGILDADLVLKVSVNGVFEPKENGNVYFPAYVSAALLGTTSAGMLNPITQLPAAVTVITQAPGTSNTSPANTAFVMAAVSASTDTTLVTAVGGGINILKDIVNTNPKEWTFRTLVNGTNTTARLVGTDGITFDAVGGAGMDEAASYNFTGVNTFSNAATPMSVTRSTAGDILSVAGPTGTMTMGNNVYASTLNATGRLDIRTPTRLFLGGEQVMMEANVNLTRVGDVGAISVATQKSSRDLVFENALYNGDNYYSYNGIQSRASTTVSGLSSLVFRMNSPVNPDLFGGYDALEIRSDSAYLFNALNRGGSGGDSIPMITGADQRLLKFAPAHPRTGTPVFNIVGGAGTGATATVTGNDLGGFIEVVTGSTGTFGVLAGNLVFSTPYAFNPSVVVSGRSINAGLLHPVAIGNIINTNVIVGTGLPLVASTTYQIHYIIQQ